MGHNPTFVTTVLNIKKKELILKIINNMRILITWESYLPKLAKKEFT